MDEIDEKVPQPLPTVTGIAARLAIATLKEAKCLLRDCSNAPVFRLKT
jgi:hypothetical protein